MKTNTSQSQLKQFLHSHIVELTGPYTASGTGMLYACSGVHADAYVVAGRYSEEYVVEDGAWPFTSMDLALYFTVPLALGWAGAKRHYLVNSGGPCHLKTAAIRPTARLGRASRCSWPGASDSVQIR
jgi:hypothetical protein